MKFDINKRLIYAYEFSDKHVYVGLTYNIKKRNNEHLRMNINNKSCVYKHIINSGLSPNLIVVTDYMRTEEACLKEGEILNNYKTNNWIILNISKTGSPGGQKDYWSKNELIKEALKYKTKNEFQQKSKSAYLAAYRRNILNDICSHMIITKKENGYWTIEKCFMEAKKYNNKKDFRENCVQANKVLRKHKLFDEACSHMKNLINKNNYWNEEKCKEKSLLCNTRTDFKMKFGVAYQVSIKNNWLNNFFPK